MSHARMLRGQAAESYHTARGIQRKAHDDGRHLDAEELSNVNAAMDDAEEKLRKARELETVEERSNALRETFETPNRLAPRGDGDKAARSADALLDPKTTEDAEYKSAFMNYLRGRPTERKVLDTRVDPDGGYISTEEMATQLITKVRDLVKMRAACTVLTTSAKAVAFPTFDFEGDVPVVGQNAEATATDVSDLFGKTRFTPHKRMVIWKVPAELIEDADFDIVGFLTTHFARRFAEIEEADIIAGPGGEKYLGLKTATLPEADAASSGLVLVPEDVFASVYAIKEQYRRSARFIMPRLVIKRVRLLRDLSGGAGTGQYMWQPGLQAGQPDRLAGFDVMETEYLAEPAATGDPWWFFGDTTTYWIVDRTGIAVQRLDEKYAEFDQIGIKMRRRSDGAPVLDESWHRLNRKA